MFFAKSFSSSQKYSHRYFTFEWLLSLMDWRAQSLNLNLTWFFWTWTYIMFILNWFGDNAIPIFNLQWIAFLMDWCNMFSQAVFSITTLVTSMGEHNEIYSTYLYQIYNFEIPSQVYSLIFTRVYKHQKSAKLDSGIL